MAEGKATHGGNASSPALSPDNVLRAMEGIEKWKELCSSSCGIRIPRAKLDEIETQQQFLIIECKRAAISFWLKYDPAPSWRRLIVGLDEIEAHEVAEKIRKYAEPLRESTLTHENVLKVLQSVQAETWDNLAFALRVPVTKREEIKRQFCTPKQQREALVTYWLQVVPNASWEMLAGALYFWENSKAVKAAKSYYVDKYQDERFTVKNLCTALEDVGDVNDLGLYLHVPNSKRCKFRGNHRLLLKHWFNNHPSPSWQLIEEALFQLGEYDVLKQVQEKYSSFQEDPLSIDTLGDITIYLHQLDKTAIFNLGLVLGLAYNRLKAMTDSPSFLPDMLAGWLQRVDHVLRIGFPTWTRLVEALRDPRVGQNGLATKIEQDKLKAFQLITGH